MTTIDHLDVCAIDGRVFEITGELTIAGSSTSKLLGKISNNRTCLVNYFIRSNQGPVTISLIENPIITDNGVIVPSINRNRNSSNISDTIVYSSPTATDGDIIYSSYVHEVGTGSHIQGGESEMKSTIIFKDNTDYIFEVINGNIGETKVSFSILWCEEE